MKKMPAPSKVVNPKGKSGRGGKILKALVAQPRYLATIAFGVSGCLVGLLTGLNSIPEYLHTDPVTESLLLGAYISDPHVDLSLGLQTALTGLMMGSCLGFSSVSDAKALFFSLIFSVVLAVVVYTFTLSILAAGLAFVIGHAPAFLSYRALAQKSS